jgi:hypothetical protein
MEVFSRIIDNPVGLMTAFTILFMVGMGFWMYGFFKMKIEEEAQKNASKSNTTSDNTQAND